MVPLGMHGFPLATKSVVLQKKVHLTCCLMRLHKSLSILLAEDDSDDRILFREAVDTLHVNIVVIEAESGMIAIDLLQSHKTPPDIIVLDFNMPMLSGVDCLKIIRGDKKFDKIPVVMMSTSTSQATIAEAKNAGADRYAFKPTSFDELCAIVRLICSSNLKNGDEKKFVLNSILDSGRVQQAN